MVERLEDIEKRATAEQTNEHVAMPVSAEAYESMTKTEQVILGMYRESGYENEDFSQEQEKLRALAESKKYSAARATRDLATADFWEIKPAQEVMQEVQPQKVDALYDAAVARLDKKVQALKDMVAQEKAKLDLPVAAQKERQKIDNKHSKMYNDALRNLESLHGVRKPKEEVVQKIGVVAAKPLIVTRSVEDAERDIAAENQAASGVETVPGEETPTAKFDDVEVEQDIIDSVEDEDSLTPLEAFGALKIAGQKAQAEAQAPQKKRGFFGRMNDKMLSLGVKLTTRNTESSPEENKSRKKKIAIVLAGAVAVGTALYLANQGDDNSRNFLTDMWPFGGGDGSSAKDAVNAPAPTGNTTNGDFNTGIDQIFGPEAPVETPSVPEVIAPTPEVVAPIEPNKFIQGSVENVQHFNLQSGDNIWSHVEDTVRQNHPNWSEQQVQTQTYKETANVLRQTGENWDTARSLPVGWSTRS